MKHSTYIPEYIPDPFKLPQSTPGDEVREGVEDDRNRRRQIRLAESEWIKLIICKWEMCIPLEFTAPRDFGHQFLLGESAMINWLDN